MTKLYHASPYPVVEDILRPATRNIEFAQSAGGKEIAAFTDYGDTNTPYLFAADNLQLSMTYTIPKGTRLGNMHGHGGSEILFLDQESLIGDPDLKGGVYNFESESFRQIHVRGTPIDQWVSPESINLKQAEFIPVRSLNDVMKSGVQIFQVADRQDYNAYEFAKAWDEIDANDPSGSSMLKHVQELVQSGKLRWMNEERGINAVNCLEGDRMAIKEHFIQEAQSTITLYHCLYKEPEGDALKVTCDREVNGRTDRFLFAATHLTKALAFSFSYHTDEIICNGGINDTTEEYAVICNRSKTLSAPRHVRVLAFSGEGFELVGRAEQDTRQMVSTKDMPFKNTSLVFQTDNVQDIMKQGLQIFSTEKTVDELFAEDFFGEKRENMSQKEWLHSLTKRSDFTWENNVQEINPSTVLLESFKKYNQRGNTPKPDLPCPSP